MSFQGKVVIVTGAGQGIGRVTAIAFARAGAAVVLAEADAEAGAEAEQLVLRQAGSNNGGKAKFVHCDVSSETSVRNLVDTAVRVYGKVDVLVNNAGIAGFTDMLEPGALQAFDRVLAVNLRGTFMCSKFCAEAMVKAGNGGAIVNISSTRALQSEPNAEGYASSKGGILSLTHAMAISLGKRNIRVNAICPGWIDVSAHKKSSAGEVPAMLTEQDKLQHPVGRVGQPSDVSEAVLFLADGSKSGFITGQELTIDGGMTKKMIYV